MSNDEEEKMVKEKIRSIKSESAVMVKAMITQIPENESSRKIKQLRDLYDYIEYNTSHGIYRSEFFRLAGESLRQTIGEGRLIRRAKALANVLGKMDIVVQPYEILGGTIAGIYPKAENIPPYEESKAEGRKAIEDYLKTENKNKDVVFARQTMFARIHYHGRIPYEDLQRMIRELEAEFSDKEDINHAEIGRVLEVHFTWDFGDDACLVGELPWQAINHNDLNPPRLLGMGLGGIRREILEYQAKCTPEQKEFYESELVAIDACIGFVKRWGEAFSKKAEIAEKEDPERYGELKRIADACAKVAVEKPETFFEALQLLWLIYEISHIQACAGSCASFARFDQYMYPFYKADLEAGRITEEDALLLICNLFLKVNEPKMRCVISLCLGGQTREGKDGANGITKLCLQAVQMLRQPYPNVAVRLFEGSPEWLYDMIVMTLKLGVGNPQLINDRTWVDNFMRHGYDPEDARDYYNMGCVEMIIMGKIALWDNIAVVDFPNVLQMVLDNGGRINRPYSKGDEDKTEIYTNINGFSNMPHVSFEPLRTGTLDEFDTFEKFLGAYKRQLEHMLVNLKENSDISDRIHDKYWCDPFGSLFIDDCIKKGKDLYQGGAKYDAVKVVGGFGFGTAVDSLMGIKKFVYEQKRFTLAELKKMLDENFEGNEAVRQMLQNHIPAYGNDNEETDQLAKTIFGWYGEAVENVNRQGIRGVAITSVFSYTAQASLGEITGAMPNGRLRGEMISDSIGPSQGKDMGGPTRMFRSVTTLNPGDITGACSVNIKLSPSVVKGRQGSENMKSLFKGFLESNGPQLQVNFVDSATLKAAQAEPSKYRNLIVRVAGYCEYFNNLDANLQNEIIARTAHGF
jgi:formate C-acetyltransferase